MYTYIHMICIHIYIYIYREREKGRDITLHYIVSYHIEQLDVIPTKMLASRNVPVSVKKTPPERKILRKTGFQSTKSGAGERLLPRDCRAKAGTKG